MFGNPSPAKIQRKTKKKTWKTNYTGIDPKHDVLVYIDFHSDDTCDGDALKCVTVAVHMHCDVAFFPILTITAMIQITLAMLSKV